MRYLLTAIALALASGSLWAAEPVIPFVVSPAFNVKPNEGPPEKPPCICGDDCKCKPGDCPTKCPVDPKRSTVRVDLGNHGGSGTVFWSEGGVSLVLTNKHVAICDGGVTVTHDGKIYPATRGGYCSDGDLGIIWVKAELPAVELAANDPAPDEHIRFWGRTTSFGEGRVTGSMPFIGCPTITGNHPLASGDSGSGVFNDKGELVGVNWGTLSTGQPSFFVPVSTATVFVVETCQWFPKLQLHFKDRMAARRIAKSLPSWAGGSKPEPPAVKPKAPVAAPMAPFSNSPCPGGKCPGTTTYRRGFFR